MDLPVAGAASIVASVEDLELVARLRRGDEAAFAELVQPLYGPMLRLAMFHVGNRAVAEEVVQDAWVEDRLLSRETRAEVERAVELLPSARRAVIVLRDVEGMTAAETCELLGLTEGNQRVLLHRARSKVRRALERYLDEAQVAG
jgi:DNA-directed RNA polymerase specialized sigma24 family protein